MKIIPGLTFLFTVALVPSTMFAQATWVSVIPSATDPAIRQYNTPHWICVNREILLGQGTRVKDRHQLLLFLPGTGGHNRGAKAFLETAANLGYHCIELMYPDDVAAAEVCRDDPDPNAFEAFRLALIQGGESAHVTVERTDSIENRLTKLLIHLRQRRPREGWGQFLNGGKLAWERIAVAGQSQGGGHAGLIGVKYHVARVIMFGAPKDYSRAQHQPAPWYAEKKATPVAAFFAINHRQDRQGCTFTEELENLHALGLDQLAPPVDVDEEAPPYRRSRILVTNYPGTQVDSKTAHGTALIDKNQSIFRRVWVYMLTTPIVSDQNDLPNPELR